MRYIIIVVIALCYLAPAWAIEVAQDPNLAEESVAREVETSSGLTLPTEEVGAGTVETSLKGYWGPLPAQGANMMAAVSEYMKIMPPLDILYKDGSRVRVRGVSRLTFYHSELAEYRCDYLGLPEDQKRARDLVMDFRDDLRAKHGLIEGLPWPEGVDVIKDDFPQTGWAGEFIVQDDQGRCTKLLWNGRTLQLITCSQVYEELKAEGDRQEAERAKASRSWF